MIWKRYFLKELTKVFILFIGGFYFLYILIDYSAHTKCFHQEGIGLIDILIYYLLQLSKQAEMLVPIALLISTVKVLTSLNMRNEIVAMVSAGIPLKTLMRPFFLAGAICVVLLYLNFQFIQPLSVISIDSFEENYFREQTVEEPIGSLSLADNSLLIYQKFDPEKQAFFDAYWYQNPDKIYRIQTLYPYEKVPFGEHVELLLREEGFLKRVESYATLPFPKIEFDAKSLFTAIHPPRSQSLSQLFSHLNWKGKLNDKAAETATIFFYKISIPLACFLVILAPAPFCLRFGRHLHVFLIYSLALFGMITFFTFVNACVILGESHVISPFWAVFTPLFLFFGFFGWNYAKL